MMGYIKKVFKFEIDGYRLIAEWNHIRKVVTVTETLTHISFDIIESNVVPRFNWLETNEHRIAVARFLVTTNLYELLKPVEFSGIAGVSNEDRRVEILKVYPSSKEREAQIIKKIDAEYEKIFGKDKK